MSIAQAINEVASELELMKNLPARPHTFPVTSEFTNWRSEQHAWRDTCALLNQSHHMTDLYIKGPDALKLLRNVGVNSFANFRKNKAKQFIAVNHEGYLIGDAILFALEDDEFDIVGHPTVLDWLAFQLQKVGYDAEALRDENSIDRPAGPPKMYRYELQGPNALAVMKDLLGTEVPEVKFFNMTVFNIAGHEVRALRHGMAGQPGFELFGPWDEGEDVYKAILEAGNNHGLKRIGAKAYSVANLESGWIPAPLPAIFSGKEMDEYRAWLSVDSLGSLGGSMDSENVEDYYVTPYDMGYGRSVAFDHDFIGREALENIAKNPHRNKVTLVWNSEDVAEIIRSYYEPGTPAKYIEMPKARYAFHQNDKVMSGDKLVGISMDVGYLVNEHLMVSLAVIDIAHSDPGTELTVVWGENPNTTKPNVENHRQAKARVTVAPAPYVQFARNKYRAT